MTLELESAPQDLRTGPRERKRAWHTRDWIAAPFLFLATAGTVLWQNAHVAVLWDFSYVLDCAARIAADMARALWEKRAKGSLRASA